MFSLNSYKNGTAIRNLRKECNVLLKLLESDSASFTWNMSALSRNPGMTWEFVQQNMNREWDWGLLSSNPSVTIWEIVCANPSLPWSTKGLARNPNITWEHIQSSPERDWGRYKFHLAKNPSITLDIIEKNFDYLTLEYVANNPNITLDFYLKYEHMWNLAGDIVVFENLSANPNVTQEMIRDHKEISWDLEGLSRNPNMTWEFVQEMKTRQRRGFWDEIALSRNPGVTWEDIISNPDYNWDWAEVSVNPNVTPQILKENPVTPGHGEWDWERINARSDFTIEEISELNMQDYACIWFAPGICRNNNLSLKECMKIINCNICSPFDLQSNRYLWDDVVYARLVKDKKRLRRYVTGFERGVQEINALNFTSNIAKYLIGNVTMSF